MTAETDSVSNPEKSATSSSAEQAREKSSQEATRSDGSKKRQNAAADDTGSAHLGTVELKNEDGSVRHVWLKKQTSSSRSSSSIGGCCCGARSGEHRLSLVSNC